MALDGNMDNLSGRSYGTLSAYTPTLREKVAQYLAQNIFGDTKDGYATAKKVTDALEMTTPLGLATSSYDMGRGAAESGVASPQTLMAGALTAGSMLPFSKAIGKAGSSAAKDAARTMNIFAGPTAKKADHVALEKAKKMLANGEPPEKVWAVTGWMKDVDGWKFEIDDSASRLTDGWLPLDSSGGTKVSDVLSHKELFDNYPDLSRAGFSAETGLGQVYGRYWPEQDFIEVNPLSGNPHGTTLHELQHAVQKREGKLGGAPLRRGQTSKAQFESYRNRRIEVEARNVEHRMGMSEAERRKVHPRFTKDVKD
jgi:hypothetical protein